MNVIMTTLKGRPVKNRTLYRRVLLAATPARYKGKTSSFLNNFPARPAPSGLSGNTQMPVNKRFNKLTK